MSAAMSPAELQQYLHDHIPLSRAMGVAVDDIGGDSLSLSAPLEPNINHHETLFGGSAAAVAILSAWSLVHVGMLREGLRCSLVIQRNSMEYLQPVRGHFTASARLANAEDWPRFVEMLQRRGRARISVEAVIACQGQHAGRLLGEFVALVM